MVLWGTGMENHCATGVTFRAAVSTWKQATNYAFKVEDGAENRPAVLGRSFLAICGLAVLYPLGAHWCLESTELNDFYFFWISRDEMKSVCLNLQWSVLLVTLRLMEEVQIFHLIKSRHYLVGFGSHCKCPPRNPERLYACLH